MLKRLIPRTNSGVNDNQDYYNKLISELDTEKNVQEQFFKCIYKYTPKRGTRGIKVINSEGKTIIDDKKGIEYLQLPMKDNISLFSIQVKLLCKSCNEFRPSNRGFKHSCYCGHKAFLGINIQNVGAPVNVDIDVSIENLGDLGITHLFNVKKNWKKDEIIQKDWQFEDYSFYEGFEIQLSEDLTVLGGDYFSPTPPFYAKRGFGGKFTLLFGIKVKAFPVLPLQVSSKSQYPSTFTKLATMFSDDNINPVDLPVDKHTDTILIVGSNKIHCHKLILGIGSKFFERMFASNMRESKNKEIELKEVDLETMTSLVSFIYQDKIEDEKINTDLLAAADRFEVLRLKNICSVRLSKVINMENVGRIWHCAYLHNEEDLAHLSMMYMMKQWKELSNQTEILDLCTKYPDLLYTISVLQAECLSNNSK